MPGFGDLLALEAQKSKEEEEARRKNVVPPFTTEPVAEGTRELPPATTSKNWWEQPGASSGGGGGDDTWSYLLAPVQIFVPSQADGQTTTPTTTTRYQLPMLVKQPAAQYGQMPLQGPPQQPSVGVPTPPTQAEQAGDSPSTDIPERETFTLSSGVQIEVPVVPEYRYEELPGPPATTAPTAPTVPVGWRDPHETMVQTQHDPRRVPGLAPQGFEWVGAEETLNGSAGFRWRLQAVADSTEEVTSIPTSRGGSYGGGGGGSSAEVDASEELLGELSWWPNQDALPVLLREWGSWLKDLVETNRAVYTTPNPFLFDADAEGAVADLPDSGAASGFQSSTDVMRRLQAMLGLSFGEDDDVTTKWQQVINAIPNASQEATQLLASLRFDADSEQWYSADIGQLINPRYT